MDIYGPTHPAASNFDFLTKRSCWNSFFFAPPPHPLYNNQKWRHFARHLAETSRTLRKMRHLLGSQNFTHTHSSHLHASANIKSFWWWQRRGSNVKYSGLPSCLPHFGFWLTMAGVYPCIEVKETLSASQAVEQGDFFRRLDSTLDKSGRHLYCIWKLFIAVRLSYNWSAIFSFFFF